MLQFVILAHEGRLLETILKAERGVASCGRGSQPLAPGGPGPRPPGTTTWLRGASLHGSGGNAGEGSAAPGRKSPRWSAERRASRRCGTRRASQAWPVARRSARPTKSAPVGAPPAPHRASAKRKRKTRTQKRAAGTKKTALFDIVKMERRDRRSRRHARAHRVDGNALVSRPSARLAAPSGQGAATRARAGTPGATRRAARASMLPFALLALGPGSPRPSARSPS